MVSGHEGDELWVMGYELGVMGDGLGVMGDGGMLPAG